MSKWGREQKNIEELSKFGTLLKIYLNVVFKSTEKNLKNRTIADFRASDGCGWIVCGLAMPQGGLVTPPYGDYVRTSLKNVRNL